MSYRLIDANSITFNSDGFITAENIEKMPCIYADLPNGMDGEHYVLEQEPKPMVEIDLDYVIKQKYIERAVLDKIRAEIERQEKWLLQAGCTAYNVDIAFDAIKSAVGRGDVE